MVTKSLEYVGEVLKYIKPYLGKKISSAGLQLAYGIMGMYIWHVFARNISLTVAIRTQVERDIYICQILTLSAGVRKHETQWFA